MTATLNAAASDDFIFEVNGPPNTLGYSISGSTVHVHGILWNGPTDGNGHPMAIQPGQFNQSSPFITPVPTGFEPFQPFVPALTPEELKRAADELTREPDHEWSVGAIPGWCDECPPNNIYSNEPAKHVYIVTELP